MLNWGGVKVIDPNNTFIGEGVLFDTVHPEKITIESGAVITMRSVILTHYIDGITGKYSFGNVHIKRGAFLGANTVIVKPVTIGENAVVGAGSIVTKDIPDGEIWAGNPARLIKKKQ